MSWCDCQTGKASPKHTWEQRSLFGWAPELRELHFDQSQTSERLDLVQTHSLILTAMANLLRTAKSGNDWTENELKAYNIQIVAQDAATFFERPDTPQLMVPPEFFTMAPDPAAVADPTAFKLLS